MCRYKKIDLENWCRKEHYLYYTNSLNVEVNMTANIDVSELLTFCHTNGYKFYPTLIYCVTKVLNRIENFKMFKDKNGDLCVWDSLVPNYTIFHEEDHTFSDCWTDFTDDFDSFYKNITYDMELGKTKRGIKVKSGQPATFIVYHVHHGLHLLRFQVVWSMVVLPSFQSSLLENMMIIIKCL